MAFFDCLTLESLGKNYSCNITERIKSAVKNSNISDGLCILSLKHTTCAIFLAEHELGIIQDFIDELEKLVPQKSYFHHLRGVDDNGRAHLLNIFFNRNITLPVKNSELQVGKYQDIIFFDFSKEIKKRDIIIEVISG